MKKLIVTLLAAVISLSTAFAEKPVHLFILSGQSNMVGMKPETDFLPEAKILFPDAEIAYIKVAQNGEPILKWVNEWNEIATKYGLKGQEGGKPYYPQIISQMTDLLKKHPKPASITFCWMQGERDAKTKLDKTYSDALNQLISNLRRDLNAPKMNVVIARISDHGAADDASWQAIRKIQVDVANADAHGAWVDCDDLNDKPIAGKTTNDLHYTKAGYKILGQRYARQAKALIEGRKPADNGRP
jgi:hypothetical protein